MIKIKEYKTCDRVDIIINGTFYHTNTIGCGLWEGHGYFKQVAGTCDFKLLQKSRSGKRAAIKRYLEKYDL